MRKRRLKLFLACVVILLGVVGLHLAVGKNYRIRGLVIFEPVTQEGRDTNTHPTNELFSPIPRKVEIQETRASPFDLNIDTERVFVDQHPVLDIKVEKHPQTVQQNIREDATTSETRTLIDLDEHDVDIDELFQRFVVVTAFSENHRLEAMGMIGTAQKHMPSTRIIVYDLGIDAGNAYNVASLCNVEVRLFQFQKYPPHVSDVMTYAWKVIIIKESLNEFGVIFWADASVRFKGSLRTLLPFAKEHHGYLSRIHSYRAFRRKPVPHNYFFTQQKMFDYFLINKTEYALSKKSPHVAANRQLVINSSTVQEQLIRHIYACALNRSCISPPGAKRGNHQFDASALMLVIYKYLPGEFNRANDHWRDCEKVMAIHKFWDDWYTAQYC